jgi:allantoate deiminase
MKTNLLRIKNDIEQLSKFNSTPGKGLTRLSFTEEEISARIELAYYETLNLSK